ncbi:MAG: hypothetical protein IJR26_09030 [Bacteroidales bacterium]|nr:hypothetical protein [Bacteroidales bacterium]
MACFFLFLVGGRASQPDQCDDNQHQGLSMDFAVGGRASQPDQCADDHHQ